MRRIETKLKTSLLLSLILALWVAGCAPAATVTDQTTVSSSHIDTTTVTETALPTESFITTVPTSQTTTATTTAAAPTVTPQPSPQLTTTVTTTAVTPSPVPVDPSAAIHKNALVIDTHNDTVLKIIDKDTWLPKINIAGKTSYMVDIPKLQSGGIDMATFAAYTSGYSLSGGGQDFARANSRLLALLNAMHWTMGKNSKTTRQILKFSDIAAVADSGKIGILLSIEGAYSLNGDSASELLRQYFDLGVLMLAPVWSNSNALGEGVNENFKDGSASSGGLTPLGLEIIAEMNRLGMVIDVSHMNEESFWETMAASRAPVIASHSSVYSLCPNVRNLKDSQIEAIAAAGGVVQVNFHRPFLAVKESDATLETLADHIDYIVSLAGIDYVGLGSDFDGADMPQGLPDAAAYPRITRELFSRGYTEMEIRKILGGNIARVLEEVWRMAPAAGSGAPAITPELSMGASVGTAAPTLTATISSPSGIDAESLKVIVDGVIYSAAYDETTGQMSFALPTSLSEKFHVVTFIGTGKEGATARKTIIFYIQ